MQKRIALVAAALGFPLILGADEPASIEFNRDIRPILSENCYACHGPDKNKRQADLRLDARDGLFSERKSEGKSTVPVRPGKRDESELWRRITASDPADRMPPAEAKKTLSAREVRLLGKWIEIGAPWEGHWAFQPLRSPQPLRAIEPPRGGGGSFGSNPIDAFVIEKMQREGLSPSPEADRRTLVRRLSLDLLGLPPEMEIGEGFARDERPEAYERLVDRFLGLPQYGERMAMWWLDLVRYADSVGYHGDQPISVSPFRDYVIRAFNLNKRFDEFTIEQLGGDLLENPTVEQRVAAGYNRLGMMSAEGGVQDKEYLAKYAAERVRNASGTWMAATLGCAECHDHKFDPYTTRDFYRFASFFADIQEKGLYAWSNDTGAWGPSLSVPDARQAAEEERLVHEIAAAKADIERPRPELADAQAGWERDIAPSVEWTSVEALSMASEGGATLTRLDDGSILASGKSPEMDSYTLTVSAPLREISALRVEAIPHDSMPRKSCGRAGNGNFVLTELIARVTPPEGGAGAAIAFQSASATFEQKDSAKSNPYGRWSAAAAIDGDQKGARYGWAALDEAALANHAVFECRESTPLPENGRLTLVLKQNHGSRHTLGRFRVSITAAPRPIAASGAGLARSLRDALAVPPAQRTEPQRAELAAHYRTIAPALAAGREKLAALEKALADLKKRIPTMLATVAVEPRVVRVLPRGNWMDDSGEVVAPAVPAFLANPAVHKEGGRQGNGPGEAAARRLNRLDLAHWLVAPENPLTARVVVNRLWKLFFGAGLSRKLDDLGSQGEWPSHPELLDWLSGEFIRSGWDLKRVVKLMVMSGTYRQSSLAGPELNERDPFNRLLARQSRFRLDAEVVRDNAMWISGLLSGKIGGPSVKPYQPPGYWAYLNFPTREWQNGKGDELHRRGLYTHWQRQYLHPSLLAFDAPSREECSAERTRSNTPLQSLVLLNDPTYVEAARAFAELIVRHGGRGGAADETRIDWAFRRAVGRPALPAETALLKALREKHAAEYGADGKAAGELLSVGERPAPKDIDPALLASWTSVARAILNLHETITRS